METYLDPWERPDPARRGRPLRQIRSIQFAAAACALLVGLLACWALDRQQRRDERLYEKIVVPFRQLSYYGQVLERLDRHRPGDEVLLDSLERAYAATFIDRQDSLLLEAIRGHRRGSRAERRLVPADFAALVEKNHIAGAEMVARNREAAHALSALFLLATLAAAVAAILWGARLHRLEREKRDAGEELFALIETAPEAILLLDARNGTIVGANPSARRITGYRPHVLRGLPFPRLCPGSQADGRSSETESVHWTGRALAGEEIHSSWLLLRPDGREVPCELMAIRHPSPRGELVRVTLVDLTDRVEAERARAASDERMRSVLETCGLAIRISRDWKTLYANPACLSLFGHDDLEQFLAIPVFDTYAPGYRAILVDRMRNRSLSEGYDAEGLRRDGSRFHLQASMAPIELEDGPAVIAFLIDTTETVEARQREEQSRAALEHADRLAALGTLSAGVAHEINNPNNLILLNTDLLERVLPEALDVVDRHAADEPGFRVGGLPWPEMREEIAALLEGLHGGGERIRVLVAGLKDFVRQEPSTKRAPVDLNVVVASAQRLLGGLLRASTDHFRTDLSTDLPPVLANPQQIEQIVVNLVSNACQALPDKSRPIAVSTRRAPDGWVELEVRDGGCGIPPENLPRVLDPFFTTKREHGGTGLGLSVSWGIVQAHQGQLSIANAPGGGAVATLRLRGTDTAKETA